MLKMFGALVALFVFLGVASGRDNGQWEETDAATRAWYRDLMQPDNTQVSCCGEADAYWADSYEMLCEEKDRTPFGDTRNIEKQCLYVAIITDPRNVDGRPTREIGTKVVIPAHKVKSFRDPGANGNPTGHGIVFVGAGWNPAISDGRDYVYCYLPTGGV